jgi:hypothetical protein
MTDHHPQTRPPATPRQQRYLRQLALEGGVSFVPPRSRFEASRLIDDLKRRPPDSRGETRAIQDELARGAGDAARVREQLEVTGYGSNCRWSHRVHDE